MQHYQNREQATLPGFENWRGSLSEKKVTLLEKSWAGVFRHHFMPLLPVKQLASKYSTSMGRPTKDLHTCLGAVVLQQIFDLTDEQTQNHLAFNQQWHFALDTFKQEEQLVSLKTIWTIRNHITRGGFTEAIFESITDELARKFKVDTRFQRLDSVHIHSNMANLGRVRLMSRGIEKVLNNLKRQYPELFTRLIPKEYSDRYFHSHSEDYFGSVKPSGAKARLADIATDMYWLIETVSGYQEITGLYSYKTLRRIFHDHCQVEAGEVLVIPAKQVSSDSVQNPSDPDAGYDGHKGQGYQVQVMETYTPKEDEAEPTLNLITYAKVEPANLHDSQALEPALENVVKRELTPQEAVADTSYGSDDNVQLAQEMNVRLIAPVPGRSSHKDYGGFTFNNVTQVVEQCGRGNAPERVKKNVRKGSLTAYFNTSLCSACGLYQDGTCAVVKGRRGFRLHYLRKEVRIYQRRQYEKTNEFREKYRWRSGIEATNSRYIHMTGARRLRYRGEESVSFAGITKVLGINLFRTAKYVKEIGKLIGYQCALGIKGLKNTLKPLLKTAELVFTHIFLLNNENNEYFVYYAK